MNCMGTRQAYSLWNMGSNKVVGGTDQGVEFYKLIPGDSSQVLVTVNSDGKKFSKNTG